MSELWDRVVATVERLEREGGGRKPAEPPPMPSRPEEDGDDERLGDLRALARRSLASLPDLGASRADAELGALSLGPLPPARRRAAEEASPPFAPHEARAMSIPPLDHLWSASPALGPAWRECASGWLAGSARLDLRERGGKVTLAAAVALGACAALFSAAETPPRSVVDTFARVSLSTHAEALRERRAEPGIGIGRAACEVTLEPVEIVADLRKRSPGRRPLSAPAAAPASSPVAEAASVPRAIAPAAAPMTLEEAMRRAVGAPPSPAAGEPRALVKPRAER